VDHERRHFDRALDDAWGISVKYLMLGVVAMALLSAAPPGSRKFTGKITDSMCARADHRQMQMGADDAECTIACVHAHGALYVLFDGKNAYTLSDQQLPEKLAGKKVTVVGTLDAKSSTIHVDSITAAK
jgi:hypothetical protein